MLTTKVQHQFDFKQEELNKLISGNNAVFVGNRKDGNKEQITLFAIPVAVKSYMGFEYVAMGLTFDSGDLLDALKIDAFNGNGRCYVIDSNGSVFMSSVKELETAENFDDYLEHMVKHGAVFKGQSLEEIMEDLKNGGTAQIFSVFTIRNTICLISR